MFINNKRKEWVKDNKKISNGDGHVVYYQSWGRREPIEFVMTKKYSQGNVLLWEESRDKSCWKYNFIVICSEMFLRSLENKMPSR